MISGSVEDRATREGAIGSTNFAHVKFDGFPAPGLKRCFDRGIALRHQDLSVGQADGVASVHFLARNPNDFAAFRKCSEVFGFEVAFRCEDEVVRWR